jgi:sulfatase modifying factor 1
MINSLNHIFPVRVLVIRALTALLPFVAPSPDAIAQSVPYTETVNGVAFRMVAIEGDTFQMGCTAEQDGQCFGDENPVHRVVLSDYQIGETEVTQALWTAVMGTDPSRFRACDDCPVENVDWEQIQGFLQKLNELTGKQYRLPTEAEWEFAARGGRAARQKTFSGSDDLGAVAWYPENAGKRTHAVGTKAANELGLYDMSGNVFEWCRDGYGSYSPDDQADPLGRETASRKVVRGGGWSGGEGCCRVSYRYFYPTDFRADFLGFRLVLR